MKLKGLIPILCGGGLLIGVLFVIVNLHPDQKKQIDERIIAQPVTVARVTPQSYRPVISLIGTTQVRWPVSVKAQTSAKVTWLDLKLEPGTLVHKGQKLAQLETAHLKAQLAQASSEVSQAYLDLQSEINQQVVALKMLPADNTSAYARHKPQVAAAKAALEKARAEYASAQKYLTDATIVAPFDAIILHRDVNPKQYVESGQTLFDLASSESLDVLVPVSKIDWGLLSKTLKKPDITVVDREKRRWHAKIRYIAPEVDSSTRQRQILLYVKHPYRSPQLLGNQQVWAHFKAIKQPYVCQVLLSALTRDGRIWTVDQQNKLVHEHVQLIQEQGRQVWVIFAEHPEKTRMVVLYPLVSMLPGQQVLPEPLAQGITP
ncbi:MAG: Multidrug resistance protein MdtA [Candidatus Celerinatantimonas neptuna]|nr:MAG: Multidrug resistance protein MdtA [Candidatus Celerinatantimonas neptuna]